MNHDAQPHSRRRSPVVWLCVRWLVAAACGGAPPGEPPGSVVEVPGEYTAVSAGYCHACALRADATIACWGGWSSGNTRQYAGPFTAVSTGDDYACGLRSDATVACWVHDRLVRTEDPPAGAFTTISAGRALTCGLRSDATPTCWGYVAHDLRGSETTMSSRRR